MSRLPAPDPAAADVLVVEGTKAPVGEIVKSLVQGTALTVTVENSGANALSWLASCARAPKIVLLSLALTDMDGVDVLRAIRANPRTSSARVIVIAGTENKSLKTAVIRLGVNAFCPDTDDPVVLNDRLQLFAHFSN